MSETRGDLEALAEALENGTIQAIDRDAAMVGKVYYWICASGKRYACECDGFDEDNLPINHKCRPTDLTC